MHFDFSEQQLAFAASSRRVFRAMFRDPVEAAGRPAPEACAALAEAGLLGIMAPEAAGGLALGFGDTIPVLSEAAAAGVPFPVAESILAARLLALADPAIAMPVVEGRELAAFADLSGLAIKQDGRGKTMVSGKLDAVAWGDTARWLIGVTGTQDGEPALLAVDLEPARRKQLASYDRSATMASLAVDGAPAFVLHGVTPDAVFAWQAVLSAAELHGLSRVCFEKSSEYAKTREQFGHPIGKFQAVKHMLADCAVRIESMLISVQYAAWAIDGGMWDGEQAALSARSYCAEAARKVCEDSIQIHGGIGFTWDFGLHFHLRRMARLATTPDTTAGCRRRLSALLLDRVAEGRGLQS